jgi:uncharacterized protein
MSNTAELLPFQKLQFGFAATIRDPLTVPCPADIEPRRMAIYQELLYNNVEGFISSCFPLVRRLYDDTNWHALVRDYFARHRAATPLFLQMPREFLNYLQQERTPHAADPPCLYELALFDWQKLALDIAEVDITLEAIDAAGDLLANIPVLSPLLQLHAYQFPVQRITPDFQPTQPGTTPTYLLLYRDHADEVHTLEVNAVTAHLVSQLAGGAGRTGSEILQAIAQQLQHPQPEVVMQGGLEILTDLRAREVILGTRQID